MKNFGLAIHGGAGTILRHAIPAGLERAYLAKLDEALTAGYVLLDGGKTALDAVVAAVEVMENSPLFNAGHGAVLNAEGLCELDASIMDGATLAAGAVAAVQRIRNPIRFARDVMEKSQHVMLVGVGAERFAEKLGFDLVANAYFQTPRRLQQLAKAQRIEQSGAASGHRHDSSGKVTFVTIDDNDELTENGFGTVGCVALDRDGHLAAGTSTGGMTNKKYGRVGDSPIIGAGTYANDATCAVSATGHGEYFIRTVAAHGVSSQIEYQGASLEYATSASLGKVAALGGTGGIIAIDRAGRIAMPFNTSGMYRGFRLSDGTGQTAMFGEEAR